LALGSSLLVNPAASLAGLAKQSGSRLVIVNLSPTPYDDLADVVLRGKVGEVLPQFVAVARG
jgi:NAD-dependent deacetylase